MTTPVCGDPACPNRQRIKDLEAELWAVYRLLEERREDLQRCPVHPKGERCALPAGHEGLHKWGRGD